ncbi:PIN/TRAM domain-containing protein [Petroclostridium sp. X23]|uniref:PIN/TRAM domain-containing protein n=1 Tax=Petroclostridium sp. X23 TaxID=3045146 RepID=UPI0024ACD8F7|nr:PIN/TRAM domain-containing protein [Petroclostridium sp. X23]WHH58141.1 PIN/TRAM domain-containing protein [Petroclostridium sp. X23]
MVNKAVKSIFSIVGGAIGISLIYLFYKQTSINPNSHVVSTVILYLGGGLMGASLFYISGAKVLSLLWNIVVHIEGALQKKTSQEILSGSLGLIAGLLIANLISLPILSIPVIGTILSVTANIMLGYLGMSVAMKKKDELSDTLSFLKKGIIKRSTTDSQPKILDTSVIIDGRIADICKTGFVEGPLIIPGFVLRELQHIADSSDALKRNRGRRGLDILNIIQKELEISVEIVDKDFDNIAEVDSKLLKLAEVMNGKVMTNDYNLNKVASFQGVPVLNINELANAVKPVVLPGEEMTVLVVKDGKENGQGIAYLDDGTMIVVDGGRRHMGESISVLVTSILQTPAGRMIFAKPKLEIERAG